MKTLISAILALASVAAQAQNSSWTLTEVPNANKEPVGYIYHVYSRGTATLAGTDSTVAAGLRFVCSTKGAQEPIVAVFWNGVLMSGTSQELEIIVDKIALLKPKWTHEGSLIYSPVSSHPDLLSALKRGRAVKFSWQGNDSAKYVVTFELKDFNLANFNTSCKTNL
jgi:hypothetical protein